MQANIMERLGKSRGRGGGKEERREYGQDAVMKEDNQVDRRTM